MFRGQPTKLIGWLALLLCLALIAIACQPQPITTPTPTETVPGSLTPYQTPTASPSPEASTPAPTITMTPEPTATPFIHIITKDDTMLGIAFKYGVTLDELKAANPGMDPHFLSVGKPIIIPIKGGETAVPPTPGPVPVVLSAPICYSVPAGGAWCSVTAYNDQETPVENVSAWISLTGPDGKDIGGQTALAPLNLIQPGASLPLIAVFDTSLPPGWTANAQLLSALPVEEPENRYLSPEDQNQQVTIAPSGLQASASGTILIPKDGPLARWVWVAVIGYAADGSVAGVRKWEAEKPCGYTPPAPTQPTPTRTPTLKPSQTAEPVTNACEPVPFAVTVYSQGPALAKVDVIVEARP